MKEFFLLAIWGSLAVWFLRWMWLGTPKNKALPKPAGSTPMPVTTEKSDWQQKNEVRNRFVRLYQNKDWAGMIRDFDGYNFEQHYETFSDYQAMAMAWWHEGDEGKAEQYIEKAVKAHNAIPGQAYVNMAILNREKGQHEKALEWLLKADPSAMRANKDWGMFYRAMRVGAECFENLGRIEEGITFLKQAPTSARILDHDLADVFQLLGRFYEKTGAYEKALKSYQKVVTVRYDKEINRRILDLNQLIYEAEAERDERRGKRNRRKLDDLT